MPSVTIAVDAFGGDLCPSVEIAAAVQAAREGIGILLVGDENQIHAKLGVQASRLPLKIVHAPDVITMDDSPSKAIRSKAQASMPVCFDLVKQGDAQAVVSAGNSGAMLACGLFKYRRIKGVDRPAIVTSFPNAKDAVVLLDMGANVDCKPINLVQFAVMGAVYASVYHGKSKPVVGILANGSEDGKGNDLTRAAHRVLRGAGEEGFRYAGYIEGKDVFRGEVDVVVTDGFTGNIVLKTAEGTASAVATFLREAIDQSPVVSKIGALMMKPAFDALKRRIDPDTYGGAPLLGVHGIAMICHGSASERAILNGIRGAHRFAREGLTPGLIEALHQHKELFVAARESMAETKV